MPQSGSPLLDLYLSYDQWKEEHDALHLRLRELCNLMRWNPGNYDQPCWDSHFRKVHGMFVDFMKDWRNHLVKERKVIYPIARTAICGGKMGPSAVLEQEDAIAGQFYEAYLQGVEEGESPENCLSRLLQVLLIIAEHFRMEDETVVPAAERLMDEIEYIGS
ncbi:hemerythrin domain-containing protein [Cohnella terricola]|uniref:Hemerythrin domain-containing protein n=1 Tax=Cohnella terricola TaxID=1289167 RepID=A0A559JQ44_9BACL|nr:hemerythrin domain-containing protein [Cohnella terricola]TVY01973.1 hemerythrin domain-containing protein [Cohnella terricola]